MTRDPDADPIDALFARLPPREPLPDWRGGLRTLAAARAALARLERELVARAMRDGATWDELAGDLGVARSTLRARHAAAARTPPGEGLLRRRSGE